ncbi:cyclic phosphodiesterase-like [Fagus crenata]
MSVNTSPGLYKMIVALAEWLRRVPAKYMGFPRESSNLSGDGLKPYIATVDHVATGFCVYLQIHPTAEAVETSAHCKSHFGSKSSTPYMPHLSILYGDMTDEEMKKAQEKATILDESISSLSFQVSRLALYKTNPDDKTLKSWEKIAEYSLSPN